MNYHQRQYQLAYGRKRFFMPRFWIMSFLSAKTETQGAIFMAIVSAYLLVSCVAQLPTAIDKTFDYYDQKASHDAR